MLEQIQEVVKKNLPQEIGDQLRKHLADAEATARRLQMAEADLQEKKRLLIERDNEVSRLQALLKAAGDVEKREKDALARENKLDVTLADQRATAAEHRAEQVKELFTLVFRNPRLMRTLSESESIPVQQGGYYQTQTKSKQVTETQESH